MPILKLEPEWSLGENQTQVKNSTEPNGPAGNYKRVEIMIGIARNRSSNPIVRELALMIVSAAGVKSQDFINEALAIGAFVKNKVRYVRDINGIETVHDPLTMIDQIRRGSAQGDCDDMALLIATLLLSIGHSPFFRIVKYNGNTNGCFQHIYVVVYEKNWGMSKPKRIVLDAILKRSEIGTEVPNSFGEEIRA